MRHTHFRAHLLPAAAHSASFGRLGLPARRDLYELRDLIPPEVLRSLVHLRRFRALRSVRQARSSNSRQDLEQPDVSLGSLCSNQRCVGNRKWSIRRGDLRPPACLRQPARRFRAPRPARQARYGTDDARSGSQSDKRTLHARVLRPTIPCAQRVRPRTQLVIAVTQTIGGLDRIYDWPMPLANRAAGV